ncbi:TIR domain-containing protein [Pseudomonas sp. S2_H01]
MLDRLKKDPSEVHELLLRQQLVEHEPTRAAFLAEHGDLMSVAAGEPLVTIGEFESDVYFILIGETKIHVGKHVISESFGAGNHIGEIAALQVVARSATVTALDEVIVLRLGKTDFKEFLTQFPGAGLALAKDLAGRLETRNANIIKPGKKHRIFAISSSEALDVAHTGYDAIHHGDIFEYAPWTAEVFKLGNYPMEDLEAELMKADFAIAIAQGDDIVESRKAHSAAPRDNVIFELGLFIGVLGRKRTILMAPTKMDIKLPTDISGITIVRYDTDIVKNPASAASAWRQVTKHFRGLIK